MSWKIKEDDEFWHIPITRNSWMHANASIWTGQMEESWQIEILLKMARKFVRLDGYDKIENGEWNEENRGDGHEPL